MYINDIFTLKIFLFSILNSYLFDLKKILQSLDAEIRFSQGSLAAYFYLLYPATI